jgi:TonB-dependent starch-binding outer membrane protein SusC
MNKFLQSVLSYKAGLCLNETLVSMIFLLLTSLYALPLQAEETLKNVNVSIMLEQATVRQALNVLEKQSDYKFFYSSDEFNTKRRVSLHFKGNMDEALVLLLGKEITYTISGKHIILKKKLLVTSEVTQPGEIDKNPLDSSTSTPTDPTVNDTAVPPDLEISGVVTDDVNEPLPGVNVLLKGTAVGTTTDPMGVFKISVPDVSAVLVFSFIGYKTVELSVGNQTTINISLQPDTETLDEVVVVGYGSVKKSDLTGAVSSISKKNLGDRQVSSIAQLIQGQAAGVDVSQGKIRIRGVTSFNNTDPLYVIDGFIGGNPATINPNDITNIEILKDASSTAIYGSRGGNGVILITTASGKPGPMKLNLRYYEGVAMVPKKLEPLNADQYTDYVLNLLSNSARTPTDKFLSGETRVDRTDWQDEVFKSNKIRELNVDFSGGSDKATYFIGLGYRRSANPTLRGRVDDNFYLRSKNSFDIKKWLRAGNNFGFAYNNNSSDSWGNGNPGNLDWIITNPTYFPVRDENGDFTVSDRNVDLMQLANSLVVPEYNSYKGRNLDYQAALWAEVEPLKGLTYRIQAGVSGNFGNTEFARESYTGADAGPGTLPTLLNKTSYYVLAPLIEQYITYQNTIGKHEFSAMIGNTWQDGVRGGGIGIEGRDLDLAVHNVLTAPTNYVTQDDVSKYASLSYFGRINYQFNNKYLLTLNLRSDGSPKFNPNNRWATFYSVAGAWKLHEEDFIKNLDFLDQLKLRGSWGLSGSDAIGNFMYQSKVYNQNVYAIFGANGTRYNGATILNSSSNDIKWETVESKSIAAEMAFLQNKLNFSVEYFDKETRDILHKVPRSISLGYGNSGDNGSAIVNAASLENKGIELVAGYRSKIGELGYSVNANYTYQRNKVTSLGDGTFIDGINRTDIGHPVGYFYGFIADGIFVNQAELDAANVTAQENGSDFYQLNTTRPGDVRFVDVNSDGHVDNADRTYLGSPHPTSLFGIAINLDFKGFDFFALLKGQTGSQIYDGNYHRYRGMTEVMNQFSYVLDRWQSEANPGNGIVPRAILGDPAQNNRPSTLRMASGNYLRIGQLSLGYSLPNALCRRIGLDNLRVYASASNFFTFSKWDYGYDPEVGGENLERGRDGGNVWPVPKTLVVGFQLGL